MKKNNNLPFILVILDGWGIAPKSKGNPIALADKHNFDYLKKNYPYTEIFAHGKYVGLPDGQVGNSEAGHLNIGAGRVVLQDSVIISNAIDDGTFFKNPAFVQMIKHVNKNKSNVHLMGLISQRNSPHMSLNHLYALIDMTSEQCENVYLHLFTDGRDSPKYAALDILRRVQKRLPENAKIASLIGRFYAMDRTKRWQRTEKAYDMLTSKKGKVFETVEKAVLHSYNKGLDDEYLEPSLIARQNKEAVFINDNDGIVFFNLRSDRARQLTKCFVQKDFNEKNPKAFDRKRVVKNISFVALTDFGPDLNDILTAYPSVTLKNTMPILLQQLRQVYIAETEKYAHVTYFINGGSDKPVDGEDRIKIPSPNVKHYDKTPKMSVYKITDKILELLKRDKYDYYVTNFANTDMIAHTGNVKAGIKAVEAMDDCIGKIYKNFLKKGGCCIFTADHGNAEKMIAEDSDEVFSEHTTNKVPFILVCDKDQNFKLKKTGKLANILPTILEVINHDHARTKADSLLKKI